jgi:signal peptidase II
MKISNKTVLTAILVIISVFIDQISKLIILKNIFFLSQGINIFWGLNIVYVENRGVSFGLLSEFNIPFYLGILSLIISGYIVYLILKTKNKLEIIGLSLILGGALGNGYDRLVNGYVVDFIDIYFKKYHWPAFNFADLFITLGAILFFIQILRNK